MGISLGEYDRVTRAILKESGDAVSPVHVVIGRITGLPVAAVGVAEHLEIGGIVAECPAAGPGGACIPIWIGRAMNYLERLAHNRSRIGLIYFDPGIEIRM